MKGIPHIWREDERHGPCLTTLGSATASMTCRPNGRSIENNDLAPPISIMQERLPVSPIIPPAQGQ